MPYALRGRNVLITGGSRGLGAEIARKFAAEGSNVAINYVSSEEPARKLAEELQQKHSVKAIILQGDGGVMSDITRIVKDTFKSFGGLDIIIGNAGWTRFSDFSDLNALSEAEWGKCWSVNVMGMKQCVSEALPIFNENPEGGCFIATSSVAAQSITGSSMAYAVTKTAQIKLIKAMAQTQGRKVRINAVMPGLLLTEWGNLYGEEKINGIKDRSALKQETDISDCADMYIAIAKNTSMTGQAIAVDSGLNIANM